MYGKIHRYVLFTVPLVVITVSFAIYSLGNTNLLLRGSHFLTASIGFLLLVFIMNSSGEKLEANIHIDSKHVFKIGAILYILFLFLSSLLIYWRGGRDILTLTLLALVVFTIIMQSFHYDSMAQRYIILSEILIFYAFMAYSLTLTYYYYYGRVDSITHHLFAKNIVQQGEITDMGIYGDFPLWHILTATQHVITGGGKIWESMYIIGGITGIISIFSVYFLTQNLHPSEDYAIWAALLTSLNPTVFFFTSYSIPRSAMVGISGLFLLYLYRREMNKSNILLIFFSLSTILYHPATPPFLFIVLLVVLSSFLIFMNNRNDGLVYSLIIFGISTLSYWTFRSVSLIATFSELIFESTVSTTGSIRAVPAVLNVAEIIERQYYGILLILLLMMIYDYLKKNTSPNRKMAMFILVSILFYMIALPGPLDLLTAFQSKLSFTRWRQYVYPYLVIPAAVSSLNLIKKADDVAKLIFLFILVLIVVTVPISSHMISPDVQIINNDRGRAYFTESETVAFDTTDRYTDGDIVSEPPVSRYLSEHKNFVYLRSRNELKFSDRNIGILRKDHSISRSTRIVGKTSSKTEFIIKIVDNNNKFYSSGSTVSWKSKE